MVLGIELGTSQPCQARALPLSYIPSPPIVLYITTYLFLAIAKSCLIYCNILLPLAIGRHWVDSNFWLVVIMLSQIF
jgi:hypothetical protein